MQNDSNRNGGMMRTVDMRCRVVHLEGGRTIHTGRRTFSARGVYFLLDRAIAAGTKLEVTLTYFFAERSR